MDDKKKLEQELKDELLWVQYRQKMLDIIEEKLLKMKQLTQCAKQENLAKSELVAINTRINNLASQVKAIDSESRKTDYDRILE